MRIWLINHYAIPVTQPGSARHYNLARELIRRNHQVVIVSSSFMHKSRQEVALNKGERWKLQEVHGVPYLWLRVPKYRSNSLDRILNMLVFAGRVWLGTGIKVLEPPQLVLASTPHPFAALAAQRVAARLGVPFLLEVRDLWPQTLVDLGRISPGHPVVQALDRVERHLYRRAARIISLLPGAADCMAEKGAKRSKVVWIPNGINFNWVPPLEPPSSRGTFTVIYAGAFGLANHMDTVLDAALILQEQGWGHRVKFRLIGEGPEKSRLQQRLAAQGIHNVHFQGALPKTLLYKELKKADIFVVNMRKVDLYKYGISFNKLYDYMATARPVVLGGNVASNPVEEAGAGIVVPPENPRAMADAIKRLALMPASQRWEMGLRGRRYVEKNHDMVKLGQRLEGVLQQVLEESSPASGVEGYRHIHEKTVTPKTGRCSPISTCPISRQPWK